MRRLRSSLLAVLLAAVPVGGALRMPTARAGEDGPQPPGAVPENVAEQVRGWIKDLASDRYEVREQARQGLERWGREAPEVLREFESAEDPEVRRSVRALLARLGTAVERVPVVAGDLARVGLVRLEARGEPLGRLLESLSTSIGGSLRAPPEAQATLVSVTLAEAPCFEAIEKLAAQAGLVGPGPFDAEGVLQLTPWNADAPLLPHGCAGPLRVRATRVQATRSLDASRPATHGLTLEVQTTPWVQLVSYRWPRVTAATDAQGRAWRPSPGSDGATTYGVGGDPRAVDTQLVLERVDADAEERLARLDLVFELRLRHERRSVSFTALEGLPRTLGTTGGPAEAGQKDSVTLESVQAAEGRNGAWTVELSCVLDGAPARASVESWLELADGVRRRLWIVGGRSTTSADGRVRVVGRVYGAGEAAPRAVHVVWFERESAGELPVTLRDVPLR